MVKIVYGTEPYRIDHEVRKLAENTTYYVQVFDAIDGVKEFLAKHFILWDTLRYL